jgi:tetratricopeptide (TPR) repeat protein
MFKDLKLKKLSTSLVLVAALSVAQAPFTSYAEAAGAEQVEKKKRKTQLVSPRVGKKVQQAFELFSGDEEKQIKSDIPGAIDVLLDVKPTKEYDKAYVNRFIGIMYANLGNKEAETIEYLKKAVEPDILNQGDHSESLKLLADMQMQVKDYKNALKNYYAWMDFSGESDGQTYIKIANAYYSLKQFDKVIEPSDKAIAAFAISQIKTLIS